MSRFVARIDALPRALRPRALTLVMGRIVRFVGTARLEVEELSPERAVVAVRNRRRVQNHIGSVHAAAVALLAETASGFVVGLSLPDGRVPVLKSMAIEYTRRYRGRLRASAELTPAQRDEMRAQEKGEVDVKVTVTDETGIEPVRCRMVWAWTPPRR